jgi:diadenosine tetraphosphate (Ap4A) HIT family hydrolase
MAETAEQVHARIAEVTGGNGRLAAPPSNSWDNFPWESVDGIVVPRVLPAPADEAARGGEAGDEHCPACHGIPPEDVVWEDEAWRLKHFGAPSGLPVVLILEPKTHLDFGQLDDDLASQHGRISNRLVRIIEGLDNVQRCHVLRYGDGGAHAHTWFVARTSRLAGVIGSPVIEWDDVLPPGPEDVWRADLHTIAAKLSNWGGDARA